MSIPRIAIDRPVTMFMVSGVIVLLGAISLLRLPVDLMPDLQLPERHRPRQLPRRRPARDRGVDHAADRAGGQRGRRPRPDQLHVVGRLSSVIRLNFAWGTDLNDAADDVRSRIDRIRAPPARGRRRADRLQVRLDRVPDPVPRRRRRLRRRPRCARSPRTTLSPRLERVPGVAAVNVNGGLRRQILRRAVAREDHRARPVGRPHRQPAARPRTRTCRSARSTRATSPTCCAARASSPTSTRSATSSC